MISPKNLKSILSSILSKNKEEHDKDINHLKTNMNKGWISSGTIENIDGSKVNESTPIGSIIAIMSNNAPTNYLICDGSEYNISDYQELADFFKNEFGSYNYFGGDGTATFAVPDLRGEFLRGTGINSHYDDSNNIHQGSGADVGVHQHATRHSNYRLSYDGYYMGWVPDSGSKSIYTGIDSTAFNDGITDNGVSRWMIPTRSLANSSGKLFITSRPTNTSVLYCIKYRTTSNLSISMYDGTHYSEEETIIGQWIDGKPLYRKVYKLPTNFVIPANAWTTTGIPSTDKEIIINSMVLRVINGEETDHFSDVNVGQWNGTLQVIRNTTQLNIYNDGYIIVEYTKTTDEPYSVDEDIAWVALDSEVDEIINRLGE